MKISSRQKRKLQKWIALILAVLSLLGPCISALTLVKREDRNCFKVIEASKLNDKKLPIYCVDTKGQKKVALTFDAAWGDEDADKILNTLKAHDVKVTFFMVGDWMRKYPNLVKRIAEEGHDVANHSNKHPHVCQMSQEKIKEDLLGAHEEIKKLTGIDCNLYRPPYGEYNNTVIEAAKECGYHTIQWDVDSIDWKGYDAPTIVQKVLAHKHLGNGSIILLHNGAKHTAEALPKIITGLKEKGYEIVPISQLIYKENYALDHEGRQYLQ